MKIIAILFLTFITSNHLACNNRTSADKSVESLQPTLAKSDSILHMLNSLSPDSLHSLLQLPADLSSYDSIENLEMQSKIYATNTGQCEEIVLASFDLITPDSETEYTLFFLIKFNAQQWIVSKPLTFESGGVDSNYSLKLEDDTTLNTSCSTIRIVEYYEDEEVSYQRHTFYTINQAREFINIFTYTPNYQLSSVEFNEEDSSGEKQHTSMTETLEVLLGLHNQFKDITLFVSKQEESVTSNRQTNYSYNTETSTYTEIKN